MIWNILLIHECKLYLMPIPSWPTRYPLSYVIARNEEMIDLQLSHPRLPPSRIPAFCFNSIYLLPVLEAAYLIFITMMLPDV